MMELSYCDFVCWTLCGLFIERISYDLDTVNAMIPKLDSFFVQVILPKVLCSEPESQKSADCSEVFVSVGRVSTAK